MLGSPNLHRGNVPLAMRLKIHDLHAQLAPLERYGLGGMNHAMTAGIHAPRALLAARCAARSPAEPMLAAMPRPSERAVVTFAGRLCAPHPVASLDWKFGLPGLAREALCRRSPPRTASRFSTRIGAAGQPIVFSHGWPLSADDWDAQMLFFLGQGYRVIAHDRRGHGRSSQTGDGHDMDHYADDLAAVTAHLDLKNAIHVGHSTGGGEVVHYLARHGESRVAKAAHHQRRAAADGEDGGQSRRPAQERVRRSAGAARRQPRAVLLRPAGGAVLRLQPAGRENLRSR